MQNNKNETEIIRINQRKSKTATAQLEEIKNKIRPEFIFIEPPHVVENKIVGVPLRHKIIASQANTKCAIICTDNSYSLFPLLQQSEIATIQCTYRQIQKVVIDIYITPICDFEQTLDKLDNSLRSLTNKNVIFGGILMQQELWGGKVTDNKEVLSEVLTTHNFSTLNNKHSPPTFKQKTVKVGQV